jgi:hypothetical protein
MASAALAAPTLTAGPAQAAPANPTCRTAGHSASAPEILASAEAHLVTVSGDLSWLRMQSDQTTTASPAAWRLHEEIDQLQQEAELFNQVRSVAFIRGNATPGSPAQFRAEEELDSLCDQVGG